MSADPRQVMRILDIRGVELRLIDGNLKMRHRTGAMPDDMIAFVRHYRPLVVAELQEQERLTQTVANIMALSPQEFVTYELEVRNSPPDDEHLAHDREALRQARQLKRLAQLAEEAQEQEAA